MARPTLTDSDVVPWVRRWRRYSWDNIGVSGPVTTKTLLLIVSITKEANNDRVARDVDNGWRGKAAKSTCRPDKK